MPFEPTGSIPLTGEVQESEKTAESERNAEIARLRESIESPLKSCCFLPPKPPPP